MQFSNYDFIDSKSFAGKIILTSFPGLNSNALFEETILANELEIFKNNYFKEVYDTLSKKFKLGRVRLLLKEPRSTLSWHKDPECRLHIPIITNQGCSMVIENVAKHLPADGKVWITNNTKYHNFFNGGEQSRIHLVACVLESPFK